MGDPANRKRLNPAQAELAAELFRYTFRVVAQFRRRGHCLGLDWDDAVAAGLLGLCQAARSYDPARGVPWSAYARKWITGAVLTETRRWGQHGFTRGRGGARPGAGQKPGPAPDRAALYRRAKRARERAATPLPTARELPTLISIDAAIAGGRTDLS
jgi:hypothetical protein